MTKTTFNLAKRKKLAATRKQAARPQIGIFWLDGKTPIPFPHDYNGIPSVGGYRTSPEDHVRAWGKVKANVPKFRGMGYDAIPRGRVTFNEQQQKFNLMLPPHLVGDPGLVRTVMRTFGLPQAKTVVMPDDHYRLRQDQIANLAPKPKGKAKKPVSVFDIPDGFDDDPEWD